jgi:hypothetical protein
VDGNMKALTALACALVALSAFTSPASATPAYSIQPLGFSDAEHTSNSGLRINSVTELNEAGHIVGYSSRFDDGADEGESAWLYDGRTTIKIGLIDAEHTRIDGYKESNHHLDSHPGVLNEAGQVIGYSKRYPATGFSELGASAWLYDGATTIKLGFWDAEHTRNDGYKSSVPLQLNEAGQVVGYSGRYNNGSVNLGLTAWLYDGATTIEIGLTGAEYTDEDGRQAAEPVDLNQWGRVVGQSRRYNGDSRSDYISTWLYNGTTTIDIGPSDAEHTDFEGNRHSVPIELNDAGRVIGNASRYNGGNSAWLYDGTTTVKIGLVGSEHTQTGDFKWSEARELNEAGYVVGTSRRYSGTASRGTSAWLYDGTTTINIGLTDLEHTRSDGSKTSGITKLNEAGQVIGLSSRYNGGTIPLGVSAWLYDGATTIDVGLTGAEHTNDDGAKNSRALRLNDAGQVTGFSTRYNGGTSQLGQDAWFYDPELDQTFSLQFSQRSDGYAYSSVGYLGEDGLVLGTYNLYDELDNSLGSRVFSFTVADGLRDLGSLVDGGLAANGWDRLVYASYSNGLGQIVGEGKQPSQAPELVYLLTPLSGLEGDYNNDGFVDAVDYTVWRNAVSGGGVLNNETESLGVVDAEDYSAWKSNYGATSSGSGGIGRTASTHAAAPEPSALLLASLGALGIPRRRRATKSPCLPLSLSPCLLPRGGQICC